MSAQALASSPAVRVEGGLLPRDLLDRVSALDPELPGVKPVDYGLEARGRVAEAIARSWSRLHATWTPAATERWTLDLFEELGWGRLIVAAPIVVGERMFPVSHGTAHVPIHLTAAGAELGRAVMLEDGSRRSPHGLVQEVLNESEGQLWGLVTNGRELRLLRDSAALSRQAFVAFDLDAIFGGERYADFALLWLVGHRTRFAGERPAECLLERWMQFAHEQGIRALDALRAGVEQAILALGSGFLADPASTQLRHAIESGELTEQAYERELLRLVYRLIVLFVAEDRGLLHPTAATDAAKDTYAAWFSTRRLRRTASNVRGGVHGDQWQTLQLVLDGLGSRDGLSALGLPALGGLFNGDQTPHLNAAGIANEYLLEAIRQLSTTTEQRKGKARTTRAIDFRNLASEELGSVYESLLELRPKIDLHSWTFHLESVAGSDRKTTGSYYTPSSLIDCLLDSALDPVIDEAAAADDPEKTLLALTVCDPACGSGHFLVAAAHRIASRLARVRAGDAEPSAEDVRHALRDVVERCIYGVDLNPMAVELCKVALWLEALDADRPLSFLDHHIRQGNALLGTIPELIAGGVPNEAYAPLTGDDKTVVSAHRKLNATQLKMKMANSETFFDESLRLLAAGATRVERAPTESLVDVAAMRDAYAALRGGEVHRRATLVADAWCAAFVAERDPARPITTGTVERLGSVPDIDADPATGLVRATAERFGFFHWPLEFPRVFSTGGFACVLANPPWERVKLEEKQFFAAAGRPDIAEANNASARRKMIAAIVADDPVAIAFVAAKRKADGVSHLLRSSGRFPLTGRGDVNTYSVFAETIGGLRTDDGRAGCIVPTGIATDDTTKHFFADLVNSRSLVSLFSFENEERLFASVHHATKFCLLTFGRAPSATMVFFARKVEDVYDSDRRFSLTPDEIALINPNTKTCPTFRSRRDAEIAKSIYSHVPVLVREGVADGNPWDVSFMAMLHMANDSSLFVALPGAGRVPLYEGRMAHQFDHRYGTYEGQTEAQENQGVLPQLDDLSHQDSTVSILSRYWVAHGEVEARLAGKWDRDWLLGWRDTTSSVTMRTMIAGVVPRVGIGHKFLLAFPMSGSAALLAGVLNSYVLDFSARQKIGGTSMAYFVVRQLPVPTPAALVSSSDWITRRVVELIATAWDVASFADDHGFPGPPFRWNADRRFWLRAELDAFFFHEYGLPRGDVEHVMDSFWIVRDRDQKAHGCYRTKDAILAIYDEMAVARRTGRDYVTRLDPPPAHPSLRHPESTRPKEAR